MWTSFRFAPPEGDPNHPIPFELKHTPFLELAARIKAAGLDFLVSNVGGFFYPEEADQAIAEGKLDLVAMARALDFQPRLRQVPLRGPGGGHRALPAVQQVPRPGQARHHDHRLLCQPQVWL